MYFKWIFILLVLLSNDPKKIAKINALKKEAEKAFKAKNYELASSKYTLLLDSMELQEDELRLNLAHAQYHIGDTANAKTNYSLLTSSTNSELKSIAYQQLGVIGKDGHQLKKALQQLKASIKSNPDNLDARYNYEVVKKLLEEQQSNQQNQDQNKDQDKEQDQNKDQNKKQQNSKQDEQKQEKENEKQDQQGEQQEEKEENQSQEQVTKEKLEEMGLNEEKARMLLEAMRQNELKNLRLQRKKTTKRTPKNKKDW